MPSQGEWKPPPPEQWLQWRVDFARRLEGLTLHYRRWTRPRETWDHDHCAACWAKFAEEDGPDVLHEGYATGPDHYQGTGYWWVCPTCFADLKPVLGWKAADDCAAPWPQT